MKKAGKRIWTAALCLVSALLLLLPAQKALAAEESLGQNTQRLQGCDSRGNTNTETDFGNFMTDAMCWYAGADIALLPSGDLGNHLQQGNITEEALAFCLQRDAALARTEISPAGLYAYLEQGVSHITLDEDETIDWEVSRFDGYLQISGLTVTYDVTAPPGERVSELKLPGGAQLDRRDERTRFTLISTQELLEGGYGYPPAENIEILESEVAAAAAYTRHLGTVSKPEGRRTLLMGARSFWNSDGRLVGVLIAGIGLVAAVSTMDARKRKKQRGRVQQGYEPGSRDPYRNRFYSDL